MKARLQLLLRVSFLLSGFLMLMGGLSMLEQDKLAFAAIQLIAAALNLAILIRFKSTRLLKMLNKAILLMNVLVCASVGVDYTLAGKDYIQYVWFFAAVLSLVALQVRYNKDKKLHGT